MPSTLLDAHDITRQYGERTVLDHVDVRVDDRSRLALVGPNGAGKSTLMRMLSGEEAPDSGTRTVGHQVVMEYFAQDEATRLDPKLTVYETLQHGSPNDMVPAIRNILGGFLFSGDDVYKKAGVLSGGERTRLAVARMLLRPSNTLLLDEPTNHLDLDSKDVLLDALEDFGGTLIFVSHDRYFVDKLATKVIDIGGGDAIVYPGTYEQFLWSKRQRSMADGRPMADAPKKEAPVRATKPSEPKTSDIGHRKSDIGQPPKPASYEEKRKADAEARRAKKEAEARQRRVAELEERIAVAEAEVKDLEQKMAAPGFYEDHVASKPIIDRHQALMWAVGDLMNQWEALQSETKV
jgi:ATP-binding cassette subfamily F protein 3